VPQWLSVEWSSAVSNHGGYGVQGKKSSLQNRVNGYRSGWMQDHFSVQESRVENRALPLWAHRPRCARAQKSCVLVWPSFSARLLLAAPLQTHLPQGSCGHKELPQTF
jgi:hypothetical protein